MEASALQAPLAVGRISLNATLLRLRSDDQLVALFRAGNEEAYRVIHDRYRQRLFAYTRQMFGGSRQDAEDALQDVFLRAYAALRADDRPIALRAWLYRVAHNRCIDQLRRPLPAALDVFEVTRAPVSDPLVEAERREDLEQLVNDVRRLPAQQRSVLLMRELEGLSYTELADTHGLSLPAVKSLLVRARMGLVRAAEARETMCHDIRSDLALSHGRGVRANGRARRHLRDCPGCREYRQGLRSVQRSFGALAPGGAGAGLLAKLTGLGGGGSAAAGGAAGGGSVLGSGVATVTATKVCAVVCSVAVTATGAVEVQQQMQSGAAPAHAPAQRSVALPPPSERAPEAVFTPGRQVPDVVRRASAIKKIEPTATPPAPRAAPEPSAKPAPTQSTDVSATSPSGGVQAPVDLAGDPSAPTDAGSKAPSPGDQTAQTPAASAPHAADASPPAGGAATGTPSGGR
jgi:RNA polymerase sigma factor (sigma-70 family)